MVSYLISGFGRIYDAIYSPRNLELLEKWVMGAACTGFLIHLFLIFVARQLGWGEDSVVPGLDQHYLDAVYTPFSLILFYEVLMLVKALPESFTSSIGKQYEIISLIVVRGVFKDIGQFQDPLKWIQQTDAILAVVLDMGGAALMFLLVTVFYHVRRKAGSPGKTRNLDDFVALKKVVALILSLLLIGLAVYSLVNWSWAVAKSLAGVDIKLVDVDLIFFPQFFEIMIFTDVFLLIVSFAVFDGYEYVFRNAGFVISTVLLRFSLTSPKPVDLAVALTAMVFGIVVLGIFNYFAAISGRSPVKQIIEQQLTGEPPPDSQRG